MIYNFKQKKKTNCTFKNTKKLLSHGKSVWVMTVLIFCWSCFLWSCVFMDRISAPKLRMAFPAWTTADNCNTIANVFL